MNFGMLPFFREPMKKRFVFIFRITTVFTEHNEKRRLFPAIESRGVSIVNTDMGKTPFIPLPAYAFSPEETGKSVPQPSIPAATPQKRKFLQRSDALQ